MSLSGGPSVLNTRAAHQAAELSALLVAAGFEAVEAPAIQVVPAWSTARMADVAAGLRAGRYGWAVLPSPNVVELLVRALAPHGGAALLGAARLLCGPGTAQRLAAHGLQPARTLARFSADAALAQLLQAGVGGDDSSAVLLPRAAEGLDAVAAGLQARGTAIEEVVLYRTDPATPASLAPVAEMLARDALAAATFTSPSSVRGLLDGLQAIGHPATALLERVPLVCIGATTASAARHAGLPVAAVADETSLASLVAAVRTVVDARHPAEAGASPGRARPRAGAALVEVDR